jgi:hypothetical protein
VNEVTRIEFDKIRQETVGFLRDELAELERSALVTLKNRLCGIPARRPVFA